MPTNAQRQLIMFRKRRPTTPASDGLNALFRDQFITAKDPLTNPHTSEPGAGSTSYDWTVTGALAEIHDGSLGITGGAGWGTSRLREAEQSFARAEGRTIWAVVIPEDHTTDIMLGWASGAVADPTADGNSIGWENQQGYILATHGQKITLEANTAFRHNRPVMVLIGVAQRARGAVYFISSIGTHGAVTLNSGDRIPIPQYPLARPLWIDNVDTVTPLFPVISANATLSYPHGTRVFDLRVKDITDWSTDGFIATLTDRMDRANSTTSLGTGWTADFGTWGIDTNKGYLVSTPGGNFPRAFRNFSADGNGIWRYKITAPTTLTDGFGVMIRRVDANNFWRVWNNSLNNSLQFQYWTAGAFGGGLTSFPVSWAAGQEYDITVHTYGRWWRLYLDGEGIIGWTEDTTDSHLTGTGMGPYTGNLATGARWDDFECYPVSFTLPNQIQIGSIPRIPTVGATIATDTFTAANGTALAGRTTTSGGKTWATATITAGAGSWQIQSNAAKHSDVGDDTAPGEYGVVVDAGVTDAQVVTTITTPSVDSVIREGHLLRWTDANNYLLVRLFMDPSQVGNDEVEIIETIAGTGGIVHKINIADVFATSTAYELTTQVIGNVVHAYLDDEPVLSYQTGLATGTRFGLYHGGNDDGSFQDGFDLKALT